MYDFRRVAATVTRSHSISAPPRACGAPLHMQDVAEPQKPGSPITLPTLVGAPSKKRHRRWVMASRRPLISVAATVRFAWKVGIVLHAGQILRDAGDIAVRLREWVLLQVGNDARMKASRIELRPYDPVPDRVLDPQEQVEHLLRDHDHQNRSQNSAASSLRVEKERDARKTIIMSGTMARADLVI